ncbi:MAG: sigma-70 family RNA polymerase sigma factor [Ekhidna sp.]|uniref:RNA polymerase sigma factor n=1 Tax=Ekhidna sp. TaxID=2608089 RepID=UPI0032EFBE78
MRSPDHILSELLVVNCQQGDRKALELLIKKWNPNIVRRIYLTTKNQQASKDLAQDCWITIIEKIHSLKDPCAFEWWSLKIATSKAINWIRANQLERKRGEIRAVAQEDFSETTNTNSDEIISALRVAILELPEEQRQTIEMFYLENLKIDSIGKILNLPTGTVKSRLFKARERLKKILKTKTQES